MIIFNDCSELVNRWCDFSSNPLLFTNFKDYSQDSQLQVQVFPCLIWSARNYLPR